MLAAQRGVEFGITERTFPFRLHRALAIKPHWRRIYNYQNYNFYKV